MAHHTAKIKGETRVPKGIFPGCTPTPLPFR